MIICIILHITLLLIGIVIGFIFGVNKQRKLSDKTNGFITIHETDDDGTKIENWEFSIDTTDIDKIKTNRKAVFSVAFAK